jgi:hypothetical protein
MAGEFIPSHLTPADVPLGNIFLDPNNPRFVTSNWEIIPDDKIDEANVQELARTRLINRFGIDKLRMNMEVNGFLPIDRVVVRQFKPDKYVVLEGNRRICAAKLISNLTTEGIAVSGETIASIQKIPVLIYTGTATNAAWILQGLRHIVGLTEWSAYNKAKLLVEQKEEENIGLTEVGKRFGLSPHGAGQWVRAYYAFQQAKEESDYIAEVDEKCFTYFQEVFGKSSIAVRDWLEWDEGTFRFKNAINFNEFIGWLYPRQDEETPSETPSGQWDKRRLTRRDDLRILAYLLRDAPDLFQQFRGGTELEGVYAIALTRKQEEQNKSKADPVQEVFSTIENCTRVLDNLPLKMIRDTELKAKLLEKIDELEKRVTFVKQ